MEFFNRAKTVRLKSVHHKFLIADDDEKSVKQSRNGSSVHAKWTVEFIDGKPNSIRLKSCRTWKYLCASEDPFLLGLTGKMITQRPSKLISDPSLEWEPIKEGQYLKLKAKKAGDFLKANGRVWPWRNSVTHDMPDSTSSHNGVLWIVELLEFDNSVHGNVPSSSGGGSIPNPIVNPIVNGGVGVGGGGGAGGGGGWGRISSDVSEASSVASSRLSEVTIGDVHGERIDPVSYASEPSRSVQPTVSSPQKPIVSVSSPQKPTVSPQKMDSSASVQTSNFNPTPDPINSSPEGSDYEEASYYEVSSEVEEITVEPPQEVEEIIVEPPPPPIPIEVQKAQQTLEESRTLNFTSAYKSGQLDKIEDAIYTLLSHNYRFGPPTQQKINFHDQIQSLKTNHDSLSLEYIEFEKFKEKKSKVDDGIQEIVDKVKQHEDIAEEHEMVVKSLNDKRDELLKELNEAEEELKAAEAIVIEDKAGIEQMCNLIGMKRVEDMEMEREEKTRLRKKVEADRKMEHVESNWSSIKLCLQMMERRA